jgi:DNA replication protein DnaC
VAHSGPAVLPALSGNLGERRPRIVARYGRLELLLLDELGYVQLDTRGAELLFQIMTEREEKSSVAVASNLPFSEWVQVVTDSRFVAAIVDRMTFRAHIVETGTESFRLKSTRRRTIKPDGQRNR